MRRGCPTAYGAERVANNLPIPLVKDHLSEYLRVAEKEEVVIMTHGKAAGVLIGFETKDDWFDYRLENRPEFLKRIASAREQLKAGRGVRLEDLE